MVKFISLTTTDGTLVVLRRDDIRDIRTVWDEDSGKYLGEYFVNAAEHSGYYRVTEKEAHRLKKKLCR